MSEALAELKKAREQIREISARVKKLRARAREEKRLRDMANEKVKELKEKRDKVNSEIRKLREELNKLEEKIRKISPSERSRGLIKRRIERLEWEIQTKVLSPKREEELVKEISKLEEELKKWDEVDALIRMKKEIQGKIDELKKEAQAFHEALLHYAKESEFHHSQLMDIINQLKKLEPDFDNVKKKLEEARRNAEALKTEIDARKKAKKKELEEERKKIEEEMKKKEAAIREEMKTKARELWNALQQGKKLTTEELMIIQTYLEGEE